MFEKVIKKVLNKGELIDKKQIAVDAFSLLIRSQKIEEFNYIPGQYIRVFVGDKSDVSGKDNIRTYSVWKINKIRNTIRIAACCHAGGPGSKWVQEIKIDEEIFFSSPKGKFTLDKTFSEYIFVGDQSSLGHLYELQRNLPQEKEIEGVIYSKPKDRLFCDVNGNFPFLFYEFDENPALEIVKLLQHKLERNNSKVIYIAGDGSFCLELNKYLKNELNWSRKSIKIKPFWTPNKKGLE